MRHRCHRHRMGTDTEHHISLMRNLAISIIEHGKIKTTHARCQSVQSFIEKLITIGRKDTLSNRRLALSKLDNIKAVRILFTTIGPKYKERPGGYTRIVKLPDSRVGDGSKVSIIGLVE
ncbi:MAG: 50S ribosomal protein L17 [Pseudomonadota bacterium]